MLRQPITVFDVVLFPQKKDRHFAKLGEDKIKMIFIFAKFTLKNWKKLKSIKFKKICYDNI